MSGASTGTSTYQTVDPTAQQSTVATAVTEEAVITGAQQIAAYFNDDLAELVRRSGVSLGRDLGAEELFLEDRRLYMTLLCSDIANLLEAQLITAVTLLLFDPKEQANGTRLVRYRAIYTIQRSLAQTGSGQKARTLERSGGLLEPPTALAGQTRFALLVDWEPNSEERRNWTIKTPPYHFQWIPAQSAAFDDSQLANPHRYGAMTPTVGELRVTRIEQALPMDLRRG